MKKNEILIMLQSLTEKEREALKEAVSVIYLNDSSDYINGLWGVVTAMIGDSLDEEGVSLESILNILDPEMCE